MQGGPTPDFGIDRLEHLTLIDASRFLTADYSWRVFHTSAGQHEFSVILIGSLPLWSRCARMVGCGQPRKYGRWFACLRFIRRVVFAAGVLVCELDDA